MKKLLLLGLIFIALSINVLAQERIITGRVFRKPNIPLTNVQISQPNSYNLSYTDRYGVFHLVIIERYEKTLNLKLDGFVPKTIAIDSAKSNYSIELVADTTQILSEINGVEYGTPNIQAKEYNPSARIGVDYNFIIDLMFNDFKSFEPLLGVENVDLLNSSGSNLVHELALNYHRFSYGLSFGYCKFTDSNGIIDRNLHNYQYAIRFGYNILQTWHFTITPLVRLKWQIINLHNSDFGEEIPLEQYLTNKELDLKFNQLIGFVGCNFAYKFNWAYVGYNKVGIGMYGGYILKLNDNPWVYSEEKHLITDKKIDVKNFNFGLYFTFYFED
ncbi:MAG: hypothetical protein WCR42_01080 [bacterium]